MEHNLVNLVKEKRTRPSGELNSLLQERFPGISLSDSRIREILNRNGYSVSVCSRKPLLRQQNTEKRLAFARKHLNKPLEFLYNILFTDAKKFECFNSKRRTCCWKKPTSLAGLERIAREVWGELTPEVLRKLIERIPRVLQAIIEA